MKKGKEAKSFRDGLDEINRRRFDSRVGMVLAMVKEIGTLQSVRQAFFYSYGPVWQKEVVLAALDELGNAPQRQILLVALELVETSVTKFDKLNQLGDTVRRVYDNLDTKTKCMIASMLELSFMLELSTDCPSIGYGVEMDCSNEALYETMHNGKHIINAQKELPDDPDISAMAEVFYLSAFIRDNC